MDKTQDAIKDSVQHMGFDIPYDYKPRYMSDHDHFEFRSECVSETGYRSHFVLHELVEAAGGHKAFALGFVEANFRMAVRQASLF